MPGDADEYAAFTRLACPHLWMGGSLVNAAHEDARADSIQTSREIPITLVGHLEFMQPCGKRMALVELPVVCTVTVAGGWRHPYQTEACGKRIPIDACVERIVKKHQSTAARQESIDVAPESRDTWRSRLLQCPGRVVGIDDNQIRTSPLLRTWPDVGCLHSHAVGARQEFRPALAP